MIPVNAFTFAALKLLKHWKYVSVEKKNVRKAFVYKKLNLIEKTNWKKTKAFKNHNLLGAMHK